MQRGVYVIAASCLWTKDSPVFQEVCLPDPVGHESSWGRSPLNRCGAPGQVVPRDSVPWASEIYAEPVEAQIPIPFLATRVSLARVRRKAVDGVNQTQIFFPPLLIPVFEKQEQNVSSVFSWCLDLYWGLLPRLNEGGGLCSVSWNINTLTTTELIIKNGDLSSDLNCLLYVTFSLFREVLIHVKSA